MEKPSSYSVAPGDRKRGGILTRGALVGVVAVALVGLVLVFPKDDLLSRLRSDKEQGDRALTITYLRNLIRTEKGDVGLRLLLVEKLIATREFAEAETVLLESKALLNNNNKQREQWADLDLALAWAKFRAAREKVDRAPASSVTPAAPTAPAASTASRVSMDSGGSARLLRWLSRLADVSMASAYAAPGDTLAQAPSAAPASPRERDLANLEATRVALETKLRAQVPGLNSPSRAFNLLAQAQDIGAAQLGRSILQRLTTIPTTTLADLLRGGKEAMAMSLYDDAAALYFAAKARTQDADARRSLVMLGVKALLSGGQSKQAYAAAVKELDAAPPGDASHWHLVDLAMGAGEPQNAVKHLAQVVPPAWDAATLAQKLEPVQLAKALEVALAGANLPEALKLTQAGLLQNPQQTALRERYAQIAEWSGKPQEALATWLALVQQGGTGPAVDKAIANVMRLSPMLFDDEALLAAWAATQARRPLTEPEFAQVLALYERLGQAQQALAFLESAIGTNNNPAALARLRSLRAQLLERSGRSADAIAALEQLRSAQAGAGLSRADALRLANLYIRAGKLPQALAALQSYQPSVQPPGIQLPSASAFDNDYWDLRADLAFETGQMGDVVNALEKMRAASQPKLLLRDYQVLRLVRYYVDAEDYPRAKAVARSLYPRLAEGSAQSALLEASQQASQDSLALLWLDVITLVPNLADLAQWLDTLTPAHRTRALQNPDIITRRAGIYASLGDKKQASADYRTALDLRLDTPTRASYWWLLIDMADLKTLRTELAAAGSAARGDSALLEVQGAAWQALGEPRKALGFYAQQTQDPSKAGDYLWLANYADLLDQAGNAALALRVRRHAFGLLSSALARVDSLKRKEAAQALLVRVRLSESLSSGDEKSRLTKLLGQVIHGTTLPADLRKQADDLIVSWALGSSNGSGPGGARTELAQHWLWQQQARKVGALAQASGAEDNAATNAQRSAGASKAYAELALALAQGDLQTLDRLIENSANSFQPIDQLAATRAVAQRQPQRLAQAATLGVELAQREPESPRNDELQEALEADLRKLASRVRTSAISSQSDPVSVRGLRTQADMAITPRLRLTTELTDLHLRTNNTVSLASVPAHDRTLAVGARWLTEVGELSAALTQRSAWAQVTGLVLQLTQQVTSRLSLQASAALHQPSSDSAALSVAGMQDSLTANLSYNLAKDLTLGLQTSTTLYRTQGGAAVGRSTRVGANASYVLRRDHPDWTAKLAFQRNLTHAEGQPEAPTASLVPGNTIPNARFFVAPSSTSWDASVGWGLSQSIDNVQAYSRAWRPYGELGLGWRKVSGESGQASGLLSVGARGSVAGRDQLAIGLALRPALAGQMGQGAPAGGKTARELRVQYEWTGD